MPIDPLFKQWVNRDGADDTPVVEGVKYNAGQLLATILDSSTEKRLDICNRMLDGADMAQACIMFDHELLAKYVREHAETIREQATVITDLNSRISELELELRDASHELRQRNVASDKNVGKS